MDFYSRCPNNNTEWQLNPTVFERLCEVVHPPVIDVFASAINKQTSQYVSWKPDPLAWAVDAFTIPWKNLNFYAFPPFSIVPRVLQKLQQDQATGICILPNWPTQAWFLVMLQLLINHPYRASPHKRLLALPRATRNTSSPQEAGPFGAAFLRGSLADLAVPEATKTTHLGLWRASMRSQYDSVLRGWGSFCLERQTNPTLPAIAGVLAYLTSLYEAGIQYNTICTARSALSGILHIPGVARLSDHPLIQRLLKGVYHNRPLNEGMHSYGIPIKSSITWPS